MSRTRHRVSRALIVLLVITIALGIVSYLHNLDRSTAAEKDAPAGGDAPVVVTKVEVGPAPSSASPSPAPADEPDVLVSQTPMIPVAPVVQVADASTTRPTAKAPPTPAPAEPDSSDASNEPVLVQSKSKMDAGKLLDARKLLNGALNAGKLSEADARSARQMMSEINHTIVFSSKKFADDKFGGTYSVKPGQRLSTIAAEHDITWEFLARLNGISDPAKMKAGANLKIINGPFHAVVDKSDYTMDLYLGGTPGDTSAMYVTTFRVGLGSDDSTPTGIWMVEPQKKLKNPTYYSPRGEGVIAGDDPKNPLGEFWIGLTGIDGHAVGKASYGIHGTIEPESIGKMESLGCIRMLNEDIARVYEMLVEGKSTVVVKD